MLQLPHGNRCSADGPKVSPQNWQKLTKIKGPWRMYYRFYPASGGSELIQIKGMNDLVNLEERKLVTERLLDQERSMLLAGYNPVTKKLIPEVSMSLEHDHMLFIPALRLGLSKLTLVEKTKKDIGRMIATCEKAAKLLGFEFIQIKDIRRKHMKALLEQCRSIMENFTDNTFNHYRAHLMMVFRELVEMEAIETNPLRDVRKIAFERPDRETLTDKQRVFVDNYLKERSPEFHRFLHMFFHSGNRITELLALQGKDVDLSRQGYWVWIKKGRAKRRVWRVIPDAVLSMWLKAMDGCEDDYYLFSRYLKPGPTPIQANQITRRWLKLIKKGIHADGKSFGITADFYSLKHTHTTEVVDSYGVDIEKGQEMAARINGHKTTAMVRSIYDVKAEERHREQLKKVNVPFVK